MDEPVEHTHRKGAGAASGVKDLEIVEHGDELGGLGGVERVWCVVVGKCGLETGVDVRQLRYFFAKSIEQRLTGHRVDAMRTSKKGTRPRYAAAEKAEILRAYAQRDTSQREFCRRRALGVTTLQYWLRGGSAAPAPQAEEAKFIELKALPAPSSEWALALELPTNVMVKAAHGVDPGWLGAVVAALRCGA